VKEDLKSKKTKLFGTDSTTSIEPDKKPSFEAPLPQPHKPLQKAGTIDLNTVQLKLSPKVENASSPGVFGSTHSEALCCDSCSMRPIIGVAYKCVDCGNDEVFCENCCATTDIKDHQNHKMEKVPESIPSSNQRKSIMGSRVDMQNSRGDMKTFVYSLNHPKQAAFDAKSVSFILRVTNNSLVSFPQETYLKGFTSAVRHLKLDLSGLGPAQSKDLKITVARECFPPPNTKSSHHFIIDSTRDPAAKFMDIYFDFLNKGELLEIESKLAQRSTVQRLPTQFEPPQSGGGLNLCSTKGILGFFDSSNRR